MTLRGRVAALVAAVVAGTLLLVGVGVQAIAGRVLLGAVDRDLSAVAASVAAQPRSVLALVGPRRDRFGAAGVVQVVTADGRVIPRPGAGGDEAVTLPVDARVRAVAAGGAAFLRTERVEGIPLRIIAAPVVDGLAVQVARPVAEVEEVLDDLRRRIAVAVLLASLTAAVLARTIAGRSIRPVTDLTAKVESVRGAGDLGLRLDLGGHDEVGRLAAAFDGMLERLEAAQEAQERLIADASHELRTPLTSLRTNLDVLALVDEGRARLPAGERQRLLADVRGQIDELAAMVDGLVAIARDGAPQERWGPVDLDELVADVVAVARRRHPQRAGDIRFGDGSAGHGATSAGSAVIVGERDRLAQALTELLDNAVKHAPTGPIDVTVDAGGLDRSAVRVIVRDHGAGVPPDELPRVFERFFRSASARAAPGAGLGLALVAQVARAHGGSAAARLPEDGGFEVSVRLPRG